ncbi:Protein JINGUBANG [Linum perenne]
MGLIPCRPPLLCLEATDQDSSTTSHTNSKFLHSESSSNSPSLSSQLSLPSVPSLSSSAAAEGGGGGLCIATLHSHSSVSSLALSPDTLFSGDGGILAWNPIPNSASVTVAKVGGAVKCLAVYGELIFSGHQDSKIRVWRKRRKIKTESIKKQSINDPPQYDAVATLPTLNDRIRRCFSAKNYVEVRRHKKSTWVHHNDAVSALAFSFPLIYSASWDRSFKVWRISDFRCLESVAKAHDDAINALIVAADGFVYTGSADKTIKVWRRKNDSVNNNKSLHCHVATLEKHKSAVNALAVSGDGRVLYSGACDRSVLVWEKGGLVAGGEGYMTLVGALRGHKKAILCLAAVADLVCSGSADCSVRIWRRRGMGLGKKDEYLSVVVLEGHRKPVKCLAVDRKRDCDDEYVVYSGGLDREIRVWEIEVPTHYLAVDGLSGD